MAGSQAFTIVLRVCLISSKRVKASQRGWGLATSGDIWRSPLLIGSEKDQTGVGGLQAPRLV